MAVGVLCDAQEKQAFFDKQIRLVVGIHALCNKAIAYEHMGKAKDHAGQYGECVAWFTAAAAAIERAQNQCKAEVRKLPAGLITKVMQLFDTIQVERDRTRARAPTHVLTIARAAPPAAARWGGRRASVRAQRRTTWPCTTSASPTPSTLPRLPLSDWRS